MSKWISYIARDNGKSGERGGGGRGGGEGHAVY